MSIRDVGGQSFHSRFPKISHSHGSPKSGHTNTTNPFSGDFMKGFNPFGQDQANIPDYLPPPMIRRSKPEPYPGPRSVYGVREGNPPPDIRGVYGIRDGNPPPDVREVYGVHGPIEGPSHKYGIRPSPEPSPMIVKYGIRPRG